MDTVGTVAFGGQRFEKKEVFEKFLTYRRRMARLCGAMGMYLYDFDTKFFGVEASVISSKDVSLVASNLVDNVLYFYKNIFFTPEEYSEPDGKNSKIDEKYFLYILEQTITNLSEIDAVISRRLNERWTIDRLDFMIRAILRPATAELLYNTKVDIPILTSEYTNLASNFFVGKQVGFVNGIVDAIAKGDRSL